LFKSVQGVSSIKKAVLLYLKKHQARREERGLVFPNKRRTTQHGAFLGTTRRADLCYYPAALSLAYVEQLHCARSALLGNNRDRQDSFFN